MFLCFCIYAVSTKMAFLFVPSGLVIVSSLLSTFSDPLGALTLLSSVCLHKHLYFCICYVIVSVSIYLQKQDLIHLCTLRN